MTKKKREKKIFFFTTVVMLIGFYDQRFDMIVITEYMRIKELLLQFIKPGRHNLSVSLKILISFPKFSPLFTTSFIQIRIDFTNITSYFLLMNTNFEKDIVYKSFWCSNGFKLILGMTHRIYTAMVRSILTYRSLVLLNL